MQFDFIRFYLAIFGINWSKACGLLLKNYDCFLGDVVNFFNAQFADWIERGKNDLLVARVTVISFISIQ